MDKAKNELLKTKEELFRVVRKYAKKDPSKTYSSIEEVRNFLQQYAEHPIQSPTDYIESLDLNSVSMLLMAIREDYEPQGGNGVPPKPKEEKKEEKVVAGEIVKKEDTLPVPLGKPEGALAITPEGIENAMTIMEKINQIAEKLIKNFPPDFFVVFGENVCLRGKGIDRFLAGLPLPLELRNVAELPTEYDKEGYPTYRYSADAVNTITKMAISIYSEETSNKGFYTTRYDSKGNRIKLLPDQVNLRDVRMASYRGLRKECVKLFYGLRGMTVEEAKKIGINTSKIKVAKR